MSRIIKGLAISLLIGAFLISNTSFASSLKEFILSKANYPIIVNGSSYQGDLPVLNYEGYTYVPLRAVSELLDTHIAWNEALRQVEITHNKTSPLENKAFRNIKVSGFQGNYTVTGEARIFEATLQYEVEDGHSILLEGFETADKGAPDWGNFTINIDISEEHLPENGAISLILFEESAKDGSRINELSVPIESFSNQK